MKKFFFVTEILIFNFMGRASGLKIINKESVVFAISCDLVNTLFLVQLGNSRKKISLYLLINIGARVF